MSVREALTSHYPALRFVGPSTVGQAHHGKTPGESPCAVVSAVYTLEKEAWHHPDTSVVTELPC